MRLLLLLCCVLVAYMAADCDYMGQHISDGSTVLLRRCHTCYCHTGQLHCKPKFRCGQHPLHKVVLSHHIPQTRVHTVQPRRVNTPVHDEESPVVNAGHGGQTQSEGAKCSYHGHRYRVNEVFKINGCNRCVCRGSSRPTVRCYRSRRCEEVNNEKYCRYNGHKIKAGSYFQKDKCYVCRCLSRVFGHTIRCVHKAGCTPHHILRQQYCKYRRRHYPSGTYYRRSRCRVCYCKHGRTSCKTQNGCLRRSRVQHGCHYLGRFHHYNQPFVNKCRRCVCIPQPGGSFIKCSYSNTCRPSHHEIHRERHHQSHQKLYEVNEVHHQHHNHQINNVISNLYHHTGHHGLGVCYVAGHYYRTGQTVRAQRCRHCTCTTHGVHSVWICKNVCENPVQEQARSNPRSRMANQPVCSHNGGIYKIGTKWPNAEDHCQTCFCLQGAQVHCLRKPQCGLRNVRCSRGGNVYNVGQSFSSHINNHCTVCICINVHGTPRVHCKRGPCHGELSFQHKDTPHCEYNNRLYAVNESYRTSRCERCRCYSVHGRGVARCSNTCNNVCKYKGRRISVGKDMALPHCTVCRCTSRHSKLMFKCRKLYGNCDNCQYDGQSYYAGQNFSDSMGNRCVCSGGRIMCRRGEQYRRTVYSLQHHNQGTDCVLYGNHYQLGSRWRYGMCNICHCNREFGKSKIRCLAQMNCEERLRRHAALRRQIVRRQEALQRVRRHRIIARRRARRRRGHINLTCNYYGHRVYLGQSFNTGNCNTCTCRSIAGVMRISCVPRSDGPCNHQHQHKVTVTKHHSHDPIIQVHRVHHRSRTAKHDSPMVNLQAPQHVIHVEHVGHPEHVNKHSTHVNKPIKIEHVDLTEAKRPEKHASSTLHVVHVTVPSDCTVGGVKHRVDEHFSLSHCRTCVCRKYGTRVTVKCRHKDNCSHKAQSGFSVVQALMSRINKHKKKRQQKKTKEKKSAKEKKHKKPCKVKKGHLKSKKMTKKQRSVRSMIQDLTRVHSAKGGGRVVTTKEIQPMKIIRTKVKQKETKKKKSVKKKKTIVKKKVVQKATKKKSKSKTKQKKKAQKKKAQKKKDNEKSKKSKKTKSKKKTAIKKKTTKKDDGRRCRYSGLVLRAGSTGKLNVGGRCRLCLCKVEKDSGLSLICRRKC